MTKKESASLAIFKDLMVLHKVDHIDILLDSSTVHPAIYWELTQELGTLEVSRPFLRMNSPKVIREVALHEIAHILVGGKEGHGKIWQRKCIEIGYKNPSPYVDAKMPVWCAICPACGAGLPVHAAAPPIKQGKCICEECGAQVSLQWKWMGG